MVHTTAQHLPPNQQDTGSSSADSTDITRSTIMMTEAKKRYKLPRSEEPVSLIAVFRCQTEIRLSVIIIHDKRARTHPHADVHRWVGVGWER